MLKNVQANWPAPSWVRTLTTTRYHGSLASQEALNRLRLSQILHLPNGAAWLTQTHSTQVIEVSCENNDTQLPVADGAFTQSLGYPCVVLTADCLPVLLCDVDGSLVAALHCGWRGLLNGIIENAISSMRQKTSAEMLAYLGPAIGPCHFEVGEDVRTPFVEQDRRAAYHFQATQKEGKWLANIYQLARIRLEQSGIRGIYSGEDCTYANHHTFYSYRRDKSTGRMATLIWLEPH